MKKVVKGVFSLAFTGASALLAGACYEHGRKIGRDEVKLAPEALGAAAQGIMSKVVMAVVERRAKGLAEQEARKARARD